MLQADIPETYVLSTNRTQTIREFVRMAFKAADLAVEFKGKDEQETAVDLATGNIVMRINPRFYRPAEVDALVGDSSYAKHKLGWEPNTSLEQLCQMMVEADLRRNRNAKSF
jgi:GDPmannose 4,6-dehydratase